MYKAKFFQIFFLCGLFSGLIWSFSGLAQDNLPTSEEKPSSDDPVLDSPANQADNIAPTKPNSPILPADPAKKDAPADVATDKNNIQSNEPSQVSSNDDVILMRNRMGQGKDVMFGHYRLRIGAGKPTFNNDLKYYKELYGTPNIYPTLGVDWFVFDWYLTFGLGGRIAYYTDSGHAAKNVAKNTGNTIEKDKNSPTTLNLLPMQLLLVTEFSPFRKKWIVIDFWAGVERLYFTEVREKAKAKGNSPVKTTAAFFADDSSTTTDTGEWTNNGWKSSSVMGGAINILLNPLDESTVGSMQHTLGFGSVYLSPYYEIVTPSRMQGATFGHKTFGVLFTFETVR